MRVVSWNVNGIRAGVRHGFVDFVDRSAADIVGVRRSAHARGHPTGRPSAAGLAQALVHEMLGMTTASFASTSPDQANSFGYCVSGDEGQHTLNLLSVFEHRPCPLRGSFSSSRSLAG